MRRTAALAAFGVFLAGSVASARAAGLARETLDAHIPFAFEVRGTLLPAGDYLIRQAEDVQPNLLEIRSADRSRAAFFFVEDEGRRALASGRPRLVFDRYGDQRFLHALRLENGEREQLPDSTDEVLAARREAGRSSARATSARR